MIELEVYAKGLRTEPMLKELHSQMDSLPQIRYKIDTHHDLVYFEVDTDSDASLRQLTTIFTDIGLIPRIVGQPPDGFAADSDH